MIQFLPGWTYISKRGVRTTLMSNDGDRVTHCSNNCRSVLTIAETSLANFKRWTDEKKTERLHRQTARTVKRTGFKFQRNVDYCDSLFAIQPE